jgi:hypothetical protein
MCVLERLVEGTIIIKMAATRHKIVAMVVEILMLRGSASHVNNIEPTRANKKPKKERMTQRE